MRTLWLRDVVIMLRYAVEMGGSKQEPQQRMLDHEYSVLGGLNRAKIGHTIGGIALAVSPFVVSLALGLASLAEQLGFGSIVPKVAAWPISAAVIYTILYFVFSRFAWRFWPLSRFLKVPNLSGDWSVEGQTINADENRTLGYVWQATITITQNWDKIRVRLKTKQSGSNSRAAALMYDDIDGYRLMYHYVNDPNIDEPELRAHRGFADLMFAPDLRSARGEYFNGQGRFTFGTMKLTRKM